jgi:uncharacterized membrane protein YeaQ/YmgE (transglycosylase-associated protein family)
MHILIIIVIGAVAGWLAGQIMQGSGYGLLVNIILGIVGGFVGTWLFGLLGVAPEGSILWTILTCTVGAVVLIGLGRLIKR